MVLKEALVKNSKLNKLYPEDRAAHDWYRFVLSFPPHLVRDYLVKFKLDNTKLVLDPFCGTGTTLVECKKAGISCIGVEANPIASFVSKVKVIWDLDPDGLLEHARRIAQLATEQLALEGIEDDPIFPFALPSARPLKTLDPAGYKLLLSNSISPLPLHKALVLLDCLKQHQDSVFYEHEIVAFAKALVYSASNLHFGPEVGVGSLKSDAPVIAPWLNGVRTIAEDLRLLKSNAFNPSQVHQFDARDIQRVVPPNSVDAVITSPPYPNEKDYTRTTRLEAVLLGFINNKIELQTLKRSLLRSNTRGVYKEDEDDKWISEFPAILEIAQVIEARRLELNKTSGFERLYARVTKLYFGGMARHLANLRSVLKPGAQLAYVVGDQASYLGVMIRTGQLLAAIAQTLGYEVVSIDLFRTRQATATKEQLREEVLVLKWPGPQ
jgi:DNA modification methylase